MKFEDCSKEEILVGAGELADEINDIRMVFARQHKCGTKALIFTAISWTCLWCGADFLTDTPKEIETKVSAMTTPVLQTN